MGMLIGLNWTRYFLKICYSSDDLFATYNLPITGIGANEKEELLMKSEFGEGDRKAVNRTKYRQGSLS